MKDRWNMFLVTRRLIRINEGDEAELEITTYKNCEVIDKIEVSLPKNMIV